MKYHYIRDAIWVACVATQGHGHPGWAAFEGHIWVVALQAPESESTSVDPVATKGHVVACGLISYLRP